MISSDGDVMVAVLSPVSCANTAAATSGWIDVRAAKGSIVFIAEVGALTGSVTGKIRGATDGAGTGAADIAGATFTAVSVGGKVEKVHVSATASPFMQYVGTIVTGPAIVGVSVMYHPGLTG
jgi:hypothetical protein